MWENIQHNPPVVDGTERTQTRGILLKGVFFYSYCLQMDCWLVCVHTFAFLSNDETEFNLHSIRLMYVAERPYLVKPSDTHEH